MPCHCFSVRTLGLIVLGLMATVVCQPKNTSKNTGDPTFWIVFESIDTPLFALNPFPQVDVFVMDQSGHNTRRLTSDHRSRSPVWSSDGRQIAFLSDETNPTYPSTSDERYNYAMQFRSFTQIPRFVYRMDADGKNSTKIGSAGTGAQDLAWFPDGKRVGVRTSDRTALLFVVDASGMISDTQTTPLSESFLDYRTLVEYVPPVDNFVPTLYVAAPEPEQPYIYHPLNVGDIKSVPSISDSRASLHVMWLDGTAASYPVSAYDLAWAPDAKHFAYSAFSGEQYSILYVAQMQDEVESTGNRPLTDQALDAHGPAWSADSSRIAFMGLWKETSQVYIIGADGSALVQLSSDPKLSCYHPSWSPDGKWIVAHCSKSTAAVAPLVYEFGASSNIYLFDVSRPGAKPRQLTKCVDTSCGSRNASFAPQQILTH
jgi:Tol biopolymer transport system component